jgi:hypothetical protein
MIGATYDLENIIAELVFVDRTFLLKLLIQHEEKK